MIAIKKNSDRRARITSLSIHGQHRNKVDKNETTLFNSTKDIDIKEICLFSENSTNIQKFSNVTWHDGSSFIECFMDGVKSERGKMTWSNGASYTGEWRNGDMNGYGSFTNVKSRTCSGFWQARVQHSFYTKTFNNLFLEKHIISVNFKLEGYIVMGYD